MVTTNAPGLIAALQPFADYADDRAPSDLKITAGSALAKRQLTMGDCQRARAALFEAGAPHSHFSPCNCIEAVDTMLAERNTRIMLPVMLGADQTPRPMIVTDQIATGRGKKKAVGMFATFCPFCGTRYEPAPASPLSQDQADAS